MTTYVNRVSPYPNRKKIKIISQTPTEIIADIERNDNASINGTPINAETFTDLETLITEASGTTVTIGNSAVPEVSFTSDPQTQINQILSNVYPIGAIYMSVNSTNPSSLFGGTWQAWGAGRVPLGIGNNGETNYINVEATGGSENSIASHNHIQNAHNHTQNAHHHNVASSTNYSQNANGLTRDAGQDWFGGGYEGGTYSYAENTRTRGYWIQNSTPTNNVSTATNEPFGVTGGNRQPYITCYMWKRVS